MSKDKTKNFEIEVSRVGTFTPMSGEPVVITREMLVNMADNYDPTISEAPFVIGHPTINDPAYGQVDRFEVTEDDRLVACGDTATIDPWFKKMVSKKAYNKVSLAFFPPKATSNPKPGTWYPKQVGCLGAHPPAVPNLKPGLTQLAFSEDPDQDYSEVIECSYAVNHVNPELWRSLRDWFIEKFGKEKADEVLPSWKVATLEETGIKESSNPESGDTAAAFSDPNEENINMKTDAEKALELKVAALEAENAEKQTLIDANTISKRAARSAGVKSFCDGLVESGQVMPETATKLGAILKSLPVDETLAFGEGDEKLDLAEALMGVVTSISKESFDFSEKTKDKEDTEETLSFSAPKGLQVDPKRAALANKARKLATEESISFSEACTRLGA